MSLIKPDERKVIQSNETNPMTIAYDDLHIGFYDRDKSKRTGNPKDKGTKELYYFSRNKGDKHTVVRRRAQNKIIYDGEGNPEEVSETVIYKEAYDLFLRNKDNPEFNLNVSSEQLMAENEALRKKLEELQNGEKPSKSIFKKDK